MEVSSSSDSEDIEVLVTESPFPPEASSHQQIVRKKPSPPQENVRRTEEIEMGKLCKAIADNDWLAAKAIIDLHPTVLTVEFITSRGETPLHVAAKFGHVGIVEELVRLVTPEYLEIYDASGNTPLTMAAGYSGVIPLAQCLINKNSNALAIPIRRSKWEIPVQVAFHACLKEMGRYLYSVTPLRLFTENRNLGASFLRTCIVTGELDIALHLLMRCNELLFAVDDEEISTIERIACHLPDSLDKSQLPFWKRWVYDYIKMPSTTTTEHDVEKDGENIRAHQGLCLLYRLISGINNLSGMKEIYKMKQQHAQAAKILHLVCETVKSLDEETMNETKKALFAAARAEKVEFLLGMTKANPKLVSLLIFSHVFFDAVTNRRVEIVNLLRGFRFKHEVATMTVNEATMTVSEAMTLTENELHLNNLLYAAALLAPPSYLKHIYGAALQMQRELQWFKVIESMVDPAYMNVVNEGLNPLDIFKEKHKELRKDGERWMKDTASSCLVVGILIVAIMFAVAFIVPRGNNQALGYPISVENQLFNVFLISGVLSLFSATTSILTFLGIVTSSRYAEEDFLYSLPKKLFIGFSSLFLSIATMIVAFSVTLIIMLQHKSSRLRAFLPIAILGGILVTRFVILRFPLLVAVMSSIFGPGLFQKKVEKWP